MNADRPAPDQRDVATRPVTRPPTIRDVAAAAGVSRGTVSRYINGGRWVGAESSRAICAAIAEVGFVPNRAARSLATGRSATVAVVVGEPHDRLFGDPNYEVLLRELTRALGDEGLTMVLMTSASSEEAARALDFATRGRVAGVVLLGATATDGIASALARAGVVAVSCGRVAGDVISSVGAEDERGAFAAVEHLIACGRRELAMVAGPKDHPGAAARVAGFERALLDAGMAVGPARVLRGDWSHASGRAAGVRLAQIVAVDAVFVANDAMATGVVAELRAAGRHVPDDVAVVGFDDSGLAAVADPPLTTIQQPFTEISREIARLLREPPDGQVCIEIATELVIRGSTPKPEPRNNHPHREERVQRCP